MGSSAKWVNRFGPMLVVFSSVGIVLCLGIMES